MTDRLNRIELKVEDHETRLRKLERAVAVIGTKLSVYAAIGGVLGGVGAALISALILRAVLG